MKNNQSNVVLLYEIDTSAQRRHLGSNANFQFFYDDQLPGSPNGMFRRISVRKALIA